MHFLHWKESRLMRKSWHGHRKQMDPTSAQSSPPQQHGRHQTVALPQALLKYDRKTFGIRSYESWKGMISRRPEYNSHSVLGGVSAKTQQRWDYAYDVSWVCRMPRLFRCESLCSVNRTFCSGYFWWLGFQIYLSQPGGSSLGYFLLDLIPRPPQNLWEFRLLW